MNEIMSIAVLTADGGKITAVSHLTDVITIVLMSMVIAANIAAIILLIVLHKQMKRPKNVSDRYKEYKTTVGTVISVEKVAYYFKRYVKPEENTIDTSKKKDKDTLPSAGEKTTASVVEKHTGSEVVYKTPEQVAEENKAEALEIRKFRYKVFYEFTAEGTSNLYTGECYVYDPNAVNPGDIIEVTYKPDDPMINFTDYSIPAGFLAKQ